MCDPTWRRPVTRDRPRTRFNNAGDLLCLLPQLGTTVTSRKGEPLQEEAEPFLRLHAEWNSLTAPLGRLSHKGCELASRHGEPSDPKGLAIVISCCGPSGSKRPSSVFGEPIMKLSGGTTTISEHSAQSLKLSIGLRHRPSLPTSVSTPSQGTACASWACANDAAGAL